MCPLGKVAAVMNRMKQLREVTPPSRLRIYKNRGRVSNLHRKMNTGNLALAEGLVSTKYIRQVGHAGDGMLWPVP